MTGLVPLTAVVAADSAFILIFVAFVVLMIVGAILGGIKAKKRREALKAFARELDLRFSEEQDHGFDSRYEAFDCLSQGHSRYAHNTLQGDVGGRRCVCFDYHYATTSTDSKGRTTTHHHHFSGVLVFSGLALRPLFIRNEHWGDKISEFFGADDIDFESDEFSRKFHVKAPDRRFAYDMLHQGTMELLLDSPRFSIQAAGPLVMAWRSRRFEAKDFRAALDLVGGILDRIPKDLQEEMRLA